VFTCIYVVAELMDISDIVYIYESLELNFIFVYSGPVLSCVTKLN
jgi:hypothetical protein